MAMIDTWLNILDGWQDIFGQHRVYKRALRQALSCLCAVGRRTLSRWICVAGYDQQDWSADYRLHSRRKWHSEDLFQPILETALEIHPNDPSGMITVAYDDTYFRKNGKKIVNAFWHRDPLSPPFHPNLQWGLRYLQASLLLPNYLENGEISARGIPVSFEEVPPVKKPKKKADASEWQAYRQEKKKRNLSQYFVASAKRLRARFDASGYTSRPLLLTVDGSFCNRVCMRLDLERTSIVARARKDAKLCFRAAPGGRRTYGQHKFTPESVRQNEATPWQNGKVHYAGDLREVRYKVVSDVLWQGGTQKRPLKLIVIAGIGNVIQRRPAYLLCTNPELETMLVIQKYLDRWQIEVNFREEKQNLGAGQAQVRVAQSVSRQPAFVVATYAALILAGEIHYGPSSKQTVRVLPKWRRHANRPSCLDLLSIIRHEVANSPHLQQKLAMNSSYERTVLSAAG